MIFDVRVELFRGLDTEPQPLFPIALGIERGKRESLRANHIDAGILFRDGRRVGGGGLENLRERLLESVVSGQ
jgi:hypothetical protein